MMSGTSLDGVDAVAARISGSGKDLEIETLSFVSEPYPSDLRELLLRNSKEEGSSVLDLSQLNMRLAYQYAAAVDRAAAAAGILRSEIDLVGSHGQTVHHVPAPTSCAGLDTISTLQIGDPSAMANLLDIPVVGDFRIADMALGGQGAPLVPYFDYVYFSHEEETRGLLNIGGIANISVIPAGAEADDVYAFDTGPGNMISDALARLLFDEPYDDSGRRAAGGSFDDGLMAELLKDRYFTQEPPKSTGREYFGQSYAERLVTQCTETMGRPRPEDVMATAAMLTVLSVYQAYARFVRPKNELDVLIVSGGGKHNEFIMEGLRKTFGPIPVRTVDEYGLDSDAKEALCFAVLAHEAVNGVPTNLPSVTGASHKTILGKICVPA
ncbi:MAG: anhydro-N-acetylmuramic acid kinase [Rhodothermales bacterium]